jgi:hypothetical protein
MDTYTQRRTQIAKRYQYNDPGRFDVCRDCPLKLAMIALKSKGR